MIHGIFEGGIPTFPNFKRKNKSQKRVAPVNSPPPQPKIQEEVKKIDGGLNVNDDNGKNKPSSFNQKKTTGISSSSSQPKIPRKERKVQGKLRANNGNGRKRRSNINQKEVRKISLKDVLNDFTKIEGLSAVTVVGRDGFVIESVAPSGIDLDGVGAMAATVVGTIESLGSELNSGELEQSMTEYKDGIIIFSGLTKDTLLGLLSDKEANLGRLRYEIKKNRDKIIAEL